MALTARQQRLRARLLAAAGARDFPTVRRIAAAATTDWEAVVDAVASELTDELVADIYREIN